ncbi:MAG: acetyl-CoA carboxylase biotin carboxylase subunit [Alphaproteobacteria bacterium]|nr:acetyl-CoA carboxylase biotin carboxylase subunit [Alphaproteobacteria bacterium]
MFQKILIANRGEIALRIIRACREMGIGTVAIHSTADAEAMHVRMADESVCVGPPAARDSYLNVPAILTAAEITGADAVHPGLGFLAENSRFAQIVEDHGKVFIGPTPEQIEMLGDKIQAKRAAEAAGLPIVPGGVDLIPDAIAAAAAAEAAGYPVLIKASAGGGGRGMQRVERAENLARAYEVASSEAEAAFGDGSVYVEKAIDRPRHIEVQVLADGEGHAVHLGERDCTVQRRFQKVIEEAPSPVLTPEERAAIGEHGTALARNINYRGAGTVEFLYADGQFYFIEMNARLQVEHPVTELITGVDIVEQQIKIAAGEGLPLQQSDIEFRGHAIEARINAEDPERFIPSPGTVERYHPPGGSGVRVDSHMFQGAKVPPHYDSLVAKLIVYGVDREACRARMRRALHEYVIDGIATNLPLHARIIDSQDFIDSAIDVVWLERWLNSQ